MSDLEPVAGAVCKEKMIRLEDRINKLEAIVEELRSLTISVEKLANSVKLMVDKQQTQEQRLDDIEARDGEKWRTLVRYLVTGVVGAIVGYAMKNVGFM